MEKSLVFSKAWAFLGFADPIDFTNDTELISQYTVQYTILDCFLEL